MRLQGSKYFKENYIKSVIFLVLSVLCPKVRSFLDRPRISYEVYMPIIRWCSSSSRCSNNSTYSVFIRCCPLIREAGFTPFLLQLLAIRLSTKDICRKSSSLFILYNSFYQPPRWDGRNGYIPTLTSQ